MKLHEYQKRGIEFWLKNPRTYFAVDMGLGKTAIALHVIAKLKKPTLVIAPLRTIYSTWPDEIKDWNLSLSYSIVHGKDKLWAIQQKCDMYLTNYQSLPFIYDYLVQQLKQKKPSPFEVCIIDEGSMIKSPSSKRIKYLDALRVLFPKYRTILSGTPAPNSLQDLWSQYNFLTDGEALGNNFYRFRKSYFTTDQWNPYVYRILPKAPPIIYKKILPYTFRLDEKDHLKLPKITYNYLPVSLSKELKNQYKELKNEFILSINNIDHVAINSATLSLKLRQFLQGFLYYTTGEPPIRKATLVHKAKLTRLKELVEEINQPILCAIQFKQELEMIRNVYPNAPIIAGGTNATDATRYIKQWNRRELPLLLCHPASIAHGVNLQTGGCNILWYCQTWSLEQYQQFNKRLHRQGQKHGVVIHHLTIAGTIDDRVTRVLASKDTTQQSLLDFLKERMNYE